ncbi:hypothetical protein WISP_139997 [Willisornis vidua]|uniref:Uncharacterized protein n=1 Tax=Willisornis vidua TaxID=1566151 RepID=A0ABQ9CT28_9PASS|nr:hypothetical protein WISP_139997 [Willisornis vidua]
MQLQASSIVAGKLSGRKGPVQQWLNMSQCVPRWPRRPKASWLIVAIVWPVGPVIIPLYLALVIRAPHCKKDIEVLECVQRMMELVKGVEPKSDEEHMRTGGV